MTKIVMINANKVEIQLPCGKVFSVSTDDGTAMKHAQDIVDWSEVHKREDRAQEPTDSGVAS